MKDHDSIKNHLNNLFSSINLGKLKVEELEICSHVDHTASNYGAIESKLSGDYTITIKVREQ